MKIRDNVSRDYLLSLANKDGAYGYVSAHEIINAPSVENKGEWVFDETLDKHYYCSECKSMGVSYWDYCPYCGAKMKRR